MEEPDPKEALTPEEELRLSNELKALDLEITYGATNFLGEDTPPELTKLFLENVANFEAAHASARMVKIRDFAALEAPAPLDAITDADLEEAIQSILDNLEAAGVLIDRPAHLRPRAYYRFLVEIFLEAEITDYHAPGMIHGFSYSDYVHDEPEFIQAHVEMTLLEILNLSIDVEGEWISQHCRDQTEAITKAEALERIHIFRSKYREIKPLAFRPEEVKQTEVGLYFIFLVAWEGIPVGGGEAEEYEGAGVCQVAFEDGEWMIQGIMMPGFEF